MSRPTSTSSPTSTPRPTSARRPISPAARQRVVTVLGVVALVVLLASCAAGGNDVAGTADASGEGPYGFWWGLWHGIIAPITFIISLFDETVGIYEVHNTGGWYDFGFLFGLSMVFGGGAGGGAAAGRRR